MKNVKFTANELLDSINRELSQGDINEIYNFPLNYEMY